MSTALQPVRRRTVLLLWGAATVVGLAVGFFMAPPDSAAFRYASALVHSVGWGAACFLAVRSGAPAGRWAPVALVAAFVLDILSEPHVTALSVVGVGAGLLAVVAALRRQPHLAAAGTAVCSLCLVATLVGGLLVG